MTDEKWYRYEDKSYAPPVDEFDNICGSSSLEVVLVEFRVLRRTPKGVWLQHRNYPMFPRFVLDASVKRFACPTMELAKESFLARKRRQISIYEARISRAKEAVAKVQGRLVYEMPT